MILCIGIDPSLNSTGICMSKYNPETNEESDLKFGIIHCDKLSKKEKLAEEKYIDKFQYHVFNGLTKNAAKELSPTEFEFAKTTKLLECVKTLKEILDREVYRKQEWFIHIYVCIEAISYGSTGSTKSIFDLAGLNYLMRSMILELFIDDVTLMISPPSIIKKFATGKGNANKQEMIDAFKIAYPDFELPKMDDICDAFFMKEMAKREAKENY